MYADRPALPHGPRPVSLGASLAISSAIVAALVFVSPGIVPKPRPDGPIEIYDVPEPVAPPPEPETRQKPEPVRDAEIYTPEPRVPTFDPPPGPGTTIEEPTYPPPTGAGTAEGSGTTIAEPPAPLPLVAAAFDSKYARYLQPEYPGAELRAGREGRVSVKVLIGIDGRVKAVEKLSATSDAFFEATRRQALGKWRFVPATRGGVPEQSWKTMSVTFKITD